jgi:hypothetical protein
MTEEIEVTIEPEGRGASPEMPARGIWEAQPLSLANTARLIRLLAGQLIQKIILEAPKLEGASDTEVLVSVFRMLDEQNLAEFLSIAVDQSIDVIRDNYSAAKAVKVAIDFVSLNDFGSILGQARRLGGAGQPRKKRGHSIRTRKGKG